MTTKKTKRAGKKAAAARRTRGVLGGRSEDVQRRILDAAVAELARHGYAGLQMQEIAVRAAVNKTTLYRRWPSRVALVGAVVERLRAPLRSAPLPDTGDVEADLIAAFQRRLTVGKNVEGQAWARLLAERSTPEVHALIGAAIGERGAQWRAMVSRAIDRGQLPTDTDPQLVFDVVRAIVDSRGARVDEAWLQLSVRTVLAGARAGTLQRARG